MNLEETRKYIERRMSDVGLSIRIDSSGYQAIQNHTRGDNERLNQLYYKLVSVGSRQERREVNGVTIQIAIDDLRRMDEFMDHMPVKLEQSEKADTDRITIEQLASSLEQKVAEEIEAAVAEARKKKNGAEALDPDSSGNGADHTAADTDEVAEEGVQPSGKPPILVVDDSPTIRAAVTKALQNDFELIEATDGAKGWEILCANSKIKLVVTDLMMPNMDGFALIERIRSAKIPGIANLPIIVVTALEDPQAKVHALVAGANDFITKRTDTLELQARVVARYQLSQIVGNPFYAAGERATRDGGPPPHEIAAALLGTRTPRKISQPSLNIAAAARLHGRMGHISATGDQMTASSLHHGLEHTGAGERSRRGAFARALGLDRLARISTTTGITLVASFLVIAAIAGILYLNQLPIASTTPASEVAGTDAAPRAPALPSMDPAGAAASPQEASAGTDDIIAADKPIADSWATADGAPTRQKLEPASGEAPTDEASSRRASKEVAKADIAPPASYPTRQGAETDVASKPPPAPSRAKRTNASAGSKPALDPVTPAPASSKSAVPGPTRSAAAAISAAADVETKPPPTSATTTASAATSNPRSAIQVPVPVPVPVVPEAPAPKPASVAAGTLSEPATSAPSKTAESVVALAQLPRQASDLASNTKLTQAELTSLIHRFVFVYQAGDLQQFLSLFDDNIRTNDRTSKTGLREDYEDLFRNTSMRQMTLDDITWDIRDQTAEGAANFEVRVRRVNENQVRVYHGSLTFRVEKIGGRPRIVRMYHGQWRAQS